MNVCINYRFYILIELNVQNELLIILIDYCCIINGIDKSEAINQLKNADLTQKEEYYKNIKN